MLLPGLIALLACTTNQSEPTRTPPATDSTTEPTAHTGTLAPTADTGGVPTDTTDTESVDPGAALFAEGFLPTIDLTIDEAQVVSLGAAPQAWVPATVQISGFPAGSTAVRLKGNGSFQPIDAKPSFKLDFDRWTDGMEIDGLDELVLNNMGTDPSGMRERAAYAVYRELGIPAPRTNYAWVRVNGELKGLYVMVEEVDGRFLNRWFDDGDGPLYEMFDVDLTPDQIYQLDHDGGPDDRSSLLGLAEMLADPNARVSVEGAAWLDLDAFAAYFGASGVIGQFDAYPYSFPGDDVYLYVDPADERIHMLPHGGDETFLDEARPADYVFGLLATRCLADAACEDRFDQAIWAAQAAVESMDLLGQLDAWEAEVTMSMVRENTAFRAVEVTDARTQMRAFIEGRRARLQSMPGIDGP